MKKANQAVIMIYKVPMIIEFGLIGYNVKSVMSKDCSSI